MNIWQRKLLAYLHDPPSKCLDLAGHADNAASLMHAAGFTEDEINTYNRPADHTASAADRLPFPNSRASGLSCTFDGVRACFHHPLGGGELRFQKEFATAELAFETDQTIQPVCDVSALPADEQWRALFFAHWRLYPRNARERDYRFAFLPADTRLPDHTVWTHMQVVSALAGCATGEAKDSPLAPAFLRFQIGPVQDLIAQARSIRDLWSGSYLLSWLMAAGLKALSAKIGPDAVIFPNLANQPLLDLHWRDDLWKRIRVGGKSCWDSLGWETQELLTPNLPNIFLAIVPATRAKELGVLVAEAVSAEWKRIADAVWQSCDAADLFPDNEAGFSKTDRRKGACILPHGVLFRGGAEAAIRREIVSRGYIKGIIGLPANLFYGTGIPACIIVLDKENASARKGIFMVDASKAFIKDGNKNRLRAQDIHKIVDAFTRLAEIPRYSRMVSLTET